MGTVPVSLRLNGHPSDPFDQDVSSTCWVFRTPTYSVARNEPPATRIHMVKYYTLSVAGGCEILRPWADYTAAGPIPQAPPAPIPGRGKSHPRMLPGIAPRIRVPSVILRRRRSGGSADNFTLPLRAISCRAKLGGDRHRAGPRPC